MKGNNHNEKLPKPIRTRENAFNDLDPYSKQNSDDAEYNELLDSVVDEPNDLYKEYEQRVKKVDDDVDEDEERDTYMNAVADPGGLDAGFDRQMLEENLKGITRARRLK